MAEIRLYNTKSRKKEVFEPLDADNVRMYVCGPTVYDRAHLGNARPVIVFDVLYRLLRHVYGPDHVTYVRNFTDVDDKINATALARQKAGAKGNLEELVHERSNETIGWYLEDMDAVGALRPNEMPRATEYVVQMIEMNKALIEKGYAYERDGHVLFRVRKDKEYGSLSGRSVDDMIAGARVEVAPYKEDPMDFVLWKPSDDELPGWDSPWGRGRPGWHIECSAMAADLLGETFDIHGGGNDLQFPHHENELAQSRCMGHGFARYWLHNEMLQVEGKKMSKSLGNFFTVRDLLEQGVPGEVIRFVMLSTHYRKPMDWTEKKRAEAEATLSGWFDNLASYQYLFDEPLELMPVPNSVTEAIANDLNSSLALTELRELFRSVSSQENTSSESHKENEANVRSALGAAWLLGFNLPTLARTYYASEKFMSANERVELHDVWVTATISGLLAERSEARNSKNWSKADSIRDILVEAGVELRDGQDPAWVLNANFDPAKLEALK